MPESSVTDWLSQLSSEIKATPSFLVEAEVSATSFTIYNDQFLNFLISYFLRYPVPTGTCMRLFVGDKPQRYFLFRGWSPSVVPRQGWNPGYYCSSVYFQIPLLFCSLASLSTYFHTSILPYFYLLLFPFSLFPFFPSLHFLFLIPRLKPRLHCLHLFLS